MKYRIFLRNSMFATLVAGAIFVPLKGFAQDALPELPAPLQNLVDQGAQVRYLGKDYGVEGWVAIKNGQEQYFYVLPGQGGFVSGVLFDEKGKAVTVDQVRRLRLQGEGETLDTLAADNALQRAEAEKKEQKYEFKTPSEQLFFDVENSNWLPIGKAGTPVFYSFIDPQCPHCHEMMVALKERIEEGKVQVRMVPVGRKEESKAQAAFLLAAPDPAGTWWRHMSGDKDALPAKMEINKQGVERNMLVMQTWKLDATPLIIYRGKDEKVKIIRGNPKDLDALISDLGART